MLRAFFPLFCVTKDNRTPYYIQSSCTLVSYLQRFLRLLFSSFFHDLDSLKIPSHAFLYTYVSKTIPSLDSTDLFFHDEIGVMGFQEHQRPKIPYSHVISGVYDINTIYYLVKVLSSMCPYFKVTIFPFYSLIF